MYEIKFKRDDETIYLELEALEINRDTLDSYFNNVDKLRYVVNGDRTDIDAHDDLFTLQPGVFEYQVVCYHKVTGEEDLTRLIIHYFYCRYQYKEICHLLLTRHGVDMSVTSLKRVLRILGLKRKNIEESPLEFIVEAIMRERQGPGKNIGYRFLWQRLRRDYHLNVKQSTVLKLLRIIDPEGVEARSRYRLKRRAYAVPGPNFLWHVDGFDKLKRYGFALSGCVDGFSRKVIWLKVAKTNNNPRVIAHYYLNAIKEQECVPDIVRTDRGTENTTMRLLQIGLRFQHTDENSRENSFLKGKSTANERIEKYWKQLRNHTAGYYIDLFKEMEAKRELDPSDTLHIALLRYCFGPVLEKDIEASTKEWNEHRIRQQRNLIVPCGIPNVMYSWPEHYNGRNCGHPVDLSGIDKLIEHKTIEPELYDQEIERFMNAVFPRSPVPQSVDQAYNLFMRATAICDYYT